MMKYGYETKCNKTSFAEHTLHSRNLSFKNKHYRLWGKINALHGHYDKCTNTHHTITNNKKQ